MDASNRIVPRQDPSNARRVQRKLLEAALAQLEPKDREIIVLRDLEGYRNDDLASMLGLTLPAAKSRLHRARLRLMAQVRALVDGERDD